MTKLSNVSKLIILFALVIIAAVVIMAYGNGKPASPAQPSIASSTNTQSSSAALADAGSIPAGNASATGNTASAPAKNTGGGSAVKPSPILLVTPVPGETWTIAMQNPIQWSRAAGVTGQIELLNASTSKLVGVILNQIGSRQTSYTWNTRDLLLSRTSPSKITVMPGRYLIRISFDGNNLAPITSQPINLVQ